jgi:tetratricopeptide (TPR) repeat protein
MGIGGNGTWGVADTGGRWWMRARKRQDGAGWRCDILMMPIRAVMFACSLATQIAVAHAQTGPNTQPNIVQNSTGNGATNIGVINGQVTINGVDPNVLAAMAKIFANEMAATATAKAQAEANSAELATKLGFTSAAVGEFLRILGKDDVPLEKLPERLTEIAQHFAQTRDTLAAIEPDDPYIIEIVGRATEALEAGRLSEADRLLDQANGAEMVALREAQELKKRAQEAEDRHALSAAKMLAGRGDIARTQLRYKEAADRFEQAARLVPAGHAHELGLYLSRQADALSDLGDRQGDNAALVSAIGIYHKALEQFPRDSAASDWAQVQYDLGFALKILGSRESGTAHLDEAVAAFRLALTERQREATPIDWARTQHGLGAALFRIGERESGTIRLAEAIAAHRLALQGEPRELVPLDWAETQNDLGLALWKVGERESGTAHLAEAASDLRLALEEYTRARPAQLGSDPEQPRPGAVATRPAGDRDGAADGVSRRIAAGAGGTNPRSGAARLGANPEQPRPCTEEPRAAGRRDGSA